MAVNTFSLDIDEKEVERLLQELERPREETPLTKFAGSTRRLLVIDAQPYDRGLRLIAVVLRGNGTPEIRQFHFSIPRGVQQYRELAITIQNILKRGKCVLVEASVLGNRIWHIDGYQEVDIEAKLVDGRKIDIVIRPEEVGKQIWPAIKNVIKICTIGREQDQGVVLSFDTRKEDGSKDRKVYRIAGSTLKGAIVRSLFDSNPELKIPAAVIFLTFETRGQIIVRGIHVMPIREEDKRLLENIIRFNLEEEGIAANGDEVAEEAEPVEGNGAVAESETNTESETTKETQSNENTSEDSEGSSEEASEESSSSREVAVPGSQNSASASVDSEIPPALEHVLGKILVDHELGKKFEEYGILPRAVADAIIKAVLSGGDEVTRKLAETCRDVRTYADAFKCIAEYFITGKLQRKFILPKIEEKRDLIEKLFSE